MPASGSCNGCSGKSAGSARWVKNEEGVRRFRNEMTRLYSVLDWQLGREEYLAGEYSIADIAAWPWVFRYDWQGQDLADYPNVKRWFEAVGKRPAVERGAKVGADLVDRSKKMSDEEKELLFGLGEDGFATKRR